MANIIYVLFVVKDIISGPIGQIRPSIAVVNVGQREGD